MSSFHTYLFHLSTDSTDSPNLFTLTLSYFKIRSEHILDKCCLFEYLAWITHQFNFLLYLCFMIEFKYNCCGCDPKCSLKIQIKDIS